MNFIPVPEEVLKRLEDLEEKASVPDWLSEPQPVGAMYSWVTGHKGRPIAGTAGRITIADSALIAESRNHLPALLAEVKESRRVVTIHSPPPNFIGVCECGEDPDGPHFCGWCGKRIEWK